MAETDKGNYYRGGIVVPIFATRIITLAQQRGLGWLSRYRDWLRAGKPGDRMTVGEKFSAPVRTDPGARVLYIGYRVFPGGKTTGPWR
jgi:hypothetical protein